MPLELIADRPGHALLQTYEEPPLEPGQVRVRSLFSAVKHGTELRGFRADTPDATDRWDGRLRLHRRGEPEASRFPRPLGNMCLGEVVEAGPAVDRLKVGDRVFEHLPVRQTHTVEAGRLRPLLAAAYPLRELAVAQQAFMSKRHVGNIVVLP